MNIFKSKLKEKGWIKSRLNKEKGSLNLRKRRKEGGKFLNQNERKRDGLNLS